MKIYFKPICVTSECSYSLHLTALPQYNLILTVPVCTNYLIVSLTEHQVADLTSCILFHKVSTL